MITAFFRCFLPLAIPALTASLLAGSALAATTPRDTSSGRTMYNGAAMKCLVANDFYAVHFTAIQQGRHKGEKTDFEKYCQEIPGPGKTFQYFSKSVFSP